MTYLLDTWILSKLRKIRKYPDPSLEKWISKHDESHFFLSVLTAGEIEQGIHKLKNQKDKRILEDWYRSAIARFQGRIINLDFKIASKWGELTGTYQKKGIAIPVVDGLIAATAIVHDLIVTTENVKDFCIIDEVKLFNPWET